MVRRSVTQAGGAWRADWARDVVVGVAALLPVRVTPSGERVELEVFDLLAGRAGEAQEGMRPATRLKPAREYVPSGHA